MYDESAFMCLVTNEIFYVRSYIDGTYSYENLPGRFINMTFKGDFEDFLLSNQCERIGTVKGLF